MSHVLIAPAGMDRLTVLGWLSAPAGWDFCLHKAIFIALKIPLIR